MNTSAHRLFALFLLVFCADLLFAQTQSENAEHETGIITGRVITESGQPLPNVSVFARVVNTTTPGQSAATDNEGRFQLTGLSPANYVVTAHAPSYISTLANPTDPPPTVRPGASVTLTLRTGGVITGNVKTRAGEPVVQVPVRAIYLRDETGNARGFQSPERMTDDRGVYRLYGLLPGTYVVLAGGSSRSVSMPGAFDTDSPTYAPSSNRDTASEITVWAGEEIRGVDIVYSGEPGRTISGTVSGPPENSRSFSATLTLMFNGKPQFNASHFESGGTRSFSFSGLGDGEYEIVAQIRLAAGELAASEPRRILIKGKDVTGVELTVKPLGAITGKVQLESSTATECKGKRQPVMSEMLVTAQPVERKEMTDYLRRYSSAQTIPNHSGEFLLRNLKAELYRISVRYTAKYWYLRGIYSQTSGRQAQPNLNDLASNGLRLKTGERVKDVIVHLAEGAASLQGSVTTGEDGTQLSDILVVLVPAEKEHREDLLRYFSSWPGNDGTFAFGNLPPGRYFIIHQPAKEASGLRDPDQVQYRAKLRQDVESANNIVELKPCQNMVDYSLPF